MTHVENILRSLTIVAHTRREEAGVRFGIARTTASLRRMTAAWDKADAPCCPACMFGDRFTRAEDRLRRQEERLTQLVARLKRV